MENKVTRNREFDCVAAKRDAQEEIYADIQGMTAEQEIEYFRRTAGDGPLGEWWKTVGKKQTHQKPKQATTA